VFAGLRAGDLAATAGRRLRRIGPRLGVHQRQFGDPLRRLPHDFEGDVAAHRMPGQRETRRRLGQDPARDPPILSSRMWLATVTGPNRHNAGMTGAKIRGEHTSPGTSRIGIVSSMLPPVSSWRGLTRPSTFFVLYCNKRWMAGSSPAMTKES